MKYKEIKEKFKEMTERDTKSCWIAERKRACGKFKMAKAWNSESPRKVKCPLWAKKVLDKILYKK